MTVPSENFTDGAYELPGMPWSASKMAWMHWGSSTAVNLEPWCWT